MKLTFDGENILDAEPVIGYLHRGTEKLAEERQYTQVITLTDRLDYVASMTNNQAYVLLMRASGGHRAAGPRGSTCASSLPSCSASRATSSAWGSSCRSWACSAGTALMYAFRERERILDMFEMLCGARITLTYMRIGGVLQDAPEEFWPALRSFLNDMPGYADELQALVFDSEIVRSRAIGVAPVSAEGRHRGVVHGPPSCVRPESSGTGGRPRPYDVYDRVEFDVPTCPGGDNYDRFWVRMLEVRQSLRIIEQCCEQIEPGPVRTTMAMLFRPPPGEAYVPIEAPKGELGFYLVSDGTIAPYRCHVRSPSFMSLTLFREMLVGWKLADAIVTLGSLDFNMGEVDR